jgi:hypothetical protein
MDAGGIEAPIHALRPAAPEGGLGFSRLARAPAESGVNMRAAFTGPTDAFLNQLTAFCCPAGEEAAADLAFGLKWRTHKD